MHVIPAEILNGHNKILIDNINKKRKNYNYAAYSRTASISSPLMD
jgi:hypothetical protein